MNTELPVFVNTYSPSCGATIAWMAAAAVLCAGCSGDAGDGEWCATWKTGDVDSECLGSKCPCHTATTSWRGNSHDLYYSP